MAQNLKDFTDNLFSKDYYKNVYDVDKRSNFFMISRQMSCKFPVEACKLSTIHVNKENVMDFWHELMMKLYGGRKPSWIWIYPINKPDDSKFDKKLVDKYKKIDKEILIEYCQKHEIGNTELELLKTFDFEILIEDLERLSL